MAAELAVEESDDRKSEEKLSSRPRPESEEREQ